jgi:hypothetical protein
MPRFLPEETSRLIVTYLVLIRPLEALLCSVGATEDDRAGQKRMMEYLFVADGARWTAEHYSMALEQAFQEEMGQDIGVRDYRQIQAALSGHHLTKWKDVLTDTEDAVLEQQGHSTATHNREYNRMVDQSMDMKTDRQMRFLRASRDWQRLVFPGGQKLERATEDVASEGLEGVGNGTLVLPVLGTRRADATNGTDGIVVPMSALKSLRTILAKDNATFKSREQAVATALLIEQGDRQSAEYRKDVMIILPTGTGKTLTWMIAHQHEDPNDITIVIVPLVALMVDLAARLRKHGQNVHSDDSHGFHNPKLTVRTRWR